MNKPTATDPPARGTNRGTNRPERRVAARPVGVRTTTLADREAAEALKAAAGRCERCESDANGLIAVRGADGRFAAECLDRLGCTRRLRRLIAEEGS